MKPKHIIKLVEELCAAKGYRFVICIGKDKDIYCKAITNAKENLKLDMVRQAVDDVMMGSNEH